MKKYGYVFSTASTQLWLKYKCSFCGAENIENQRISAKSDIKSFGRFFEDSKSDAIMGAEVESKSATLRAKAETIEAIRKQDFLSAKLNCKCKGCHKTQPWSVNFDINQGKQNLKILKKLILPTILLFAFGFWNHIFQIISYVLALIMVLLLLSFFITVALHNKKLKALENISPEHFPIYLEDPDSLQQKQ